MESASRPALNRQCRNYMTQNNMPLFQQKQALSENQPLAERCRPRKLDDIAGHEQIIGSDSALRRQLRASYLPSIIFWGPPGVGKTTISFLLAREAGFEFESISAVSSGIKEVKEIIEQARRRNEFYGKRTVLFIDEIHRFNKAQQDALLQAVETGVIVLIGATTENPSFEVNAPLLSRMQVLKLEPIGVEPMRQILHNALEKDVLLKEYPIQLKAEDALIHFGGGDARRTLNLLEIAFQISDKETEPLIIDETLVKLAAAQNPLYFDKKGDYHYDTISAFIKSVRGSDTDAAVYWLAVMLEGGEDPLFIARRLIVLASEDIGNAEPYALSLASAAFDAVKKIGMPEARIILAQITTYLAAQPKSNAAYQAIQSAQNEVRKNGAQQVPLHLRNAPKRLMKELNYGGEYKYPHDYDGHFVDETYLPEKLANKKFYKPTRQGREAKIKQYLESLWKNKEKK